MGPLNNYKQNKLYQMKIGEYKKISTKIMFSRRAKEKFMYLSLPDTI